MTPQFDRVLPRVAQLVRMLSSSQDGEALAAARALGKTLAGAGADFHDLADRVTHMPAPIVRVEYRDRPQPEPRPESKFSFGEIVIDGVSYRRSVVTELFASGREAGRLNAWERDFTISVEARIKTGGLTDKQHAHVVKIFRKLGGGHQ